MTGSQFVAFTSAPGLADTKRAGFAQCVVAGGLVFVSGQTAINENWDVVATDFGGQAHQVMANLSRALEAAGSRLEDVVSMTAFFSHPGHVPEFGAIRKAAMGGAMCASTAICGVSFVIPELLLEVQATAVLRETRETRETI